MLLECPGDTTETREATLVATGGSDGCVCIWAMEEHDGAQGKNKRVMTHYTNLSHGLVMLSNILFVIILRYKVYNWYRYLLVLRGTTFHIFICILIKRSEKSNGRSPDESVWRAVLAGQPPGCCGFIWLGRNVVLVGRHHWLLPPVSVPTDNFSRVVYRPYTEPLIGCGTSYMCIRALALVNS